MTTLLKLGFYLNSGLFLTLALTGGGVCEVVGVISASLLFTVARQLG
jgi:hypothetical protein